MAAWPAYALVEADGYGLASGIDVERSEFDDGLVRQERRFHGALAARRVRGFLASDADLVRFRTWAADHAHTWFDWTDPEDRRPRRVRVLDGAGGIEYTARVRAAVRTWDFDLTLEGY